jgi:hypothetical protein
LSLFEIFDLDLHATNPLAKPAIRQSSLSILPDWDGEVDFRGAAQEVLSGFLLPISLNIR